MAWCRYSGIMLNSFNEAALYDYLMFKGLVVWMNVCVVCCYDLQDAIYGWLTYFRIS